MACVPSPDKRLAVLHLLVEGKSIRFTERIALCFSNKFENLAAGLHVAHYDFCRRRGSLFITPEMAARVTNTLWSLETWIERSQS